MILKCEKVTKKFGKIVALNSVSFEVEKGEIFAIAGPNGSGKTTMFNLISGIYAYQGKIYLEDEKITGLPSYKICHKGIARTFQTPEVFSSLPVADNIRAGVRFGKSGDHADETQRIEEIIDFVGLGGKEKLVGSNLKLIDKKRTMVATALATNPRILLVDEPMAGLNPEETGLAIEIFRKINQEMNITLIIIEHFMKVIMELANRLLVLENGRMIYLGKPSEVVKNRRVVECYLGDELCLK